MRRPELLHLPSRSSDGSARTQHLVSETRQGPGEAAKAISASVLSSRHSVCFIRAPSRQVWRAARPSKHLPDSEGTIRGRSRPVRKNKSAFLTYSALVSASVVAVLKFSNLDICRNGTHGGTLGAKKQTAELNFC